MDSSLFPGLTRDAFVVGARAGLLKALFDESSAVIDAFEQWQLLLEIDLCIYVYVYIYMYI